VTYLSLTDADREAMLETIGVASIEELFSDIPKGVRFGRDLALDPALSELELVEHLTELAGHNVHTGAELSFLGAGIYDHYVPAVVDAVLSRGELLTAYTPYQPEVSQGVLQAIFEYQTAICELTGMDVSNASGYDGTTVAADACYVAKHVTGRDKVVVCESVNPMVRQVVKTYAPGFGLEVAEVPHSEGVTDPDAVQAAAAGAAAVIFQQPNFFGCLEPVASTRSRSACSRRRGTTAARSRSAKGRGQATTSRTAGRTTGSSPPGPTTSGACLDASSGRRPTSRVAADSY
jgi:glycine dehydrogenase subunit 1